MTWILRGLAILLAIGAIVVAFIGYRLSTQPPPARPVIPVESVVQSLKPLRAGEPIRPEDVALRPVPTKPAGSFGALTQVVGKAPIADIAAGETLTGALFPAEGSLLRGLYAGERAVAIKVDEVVGLGGFAQPGDRVDILLYLRGTQETGNASSAQVVLSNVRLLAYGESVQPPAEGENMAARTSGAAEKLTGRSRTTTSAVLAIPEAAAPRFMLAANSGVLRLALRPAERTTPAPDQNANLIHLSELAQAARPAAGKQPTQGAGAAAILIHEGETIRAAGIPIR